jgi:putative SOS response-associated peptidase YedK
MCGRFVAASTPDDIAAYFEATPPDALIEPSWNVAPTDDVYAVTAEGGGRRVAGYHWGLVPAWADSPKAGARMINARSETLADKPAFRTAFGKRRCIVPADGFYEWRRTDAAPRRGRRPRYFHRVDGEPMAFAGLWALWKSPSGDWLRSSSIITTTANEAVADLHDRMPVILPASAWDDWLDPEAEDLGVLHGLLVPAPASLITSYEVNNDVNNVRNQGPHLIEPAAPETLFG